MSVLVIEHLALEGTGRLGELLLEAGRIVDTVRVHRGDAVPATAGGREALIVMGGPMGVYETERYPHLGQEIRLIEQAIRERVPVLGICLGSQLLAAALGARVRPGPRKELGWHAVELSPPAEEDALFKGAPRVFEPFHWHGDIFDLPSGAVALARSALTDLQAFRFGSDAYGLLFHLEVTAPQVAEMTATFAAELEASNLDGGAIVGQSRKALKRLEPVATQVFGRWIEMVTARAT